MDIQSAVLRLSHIRSLVVKARAYEELGTSAAMDKAIREHNDLEDLHTVLQIVWSMFSPERRRFVMDDDEFWLSLATTALPIVNDVVNHAQTSWVGTVGDCDICRKSFSDVFIDGKTTSRLWVLMCPRCFGVNGVGIGTRLGQVYDYRTKIKLAG